MRKFSWIGPRSPGETLKTHRDWVKFPIVIILSLLLAGSLFAQQSQTAVTAEDQEVIRVLALQTSNSERIDTALAQLGFPPAGFVQGPTQGYRQWPSLRKLAAAYRSAVEADGQES